MRREVALALAELEGRRRSTVVTDQKKRRSWLVWWLMGQAD